jgi:hypothetical protein
VEENERDDLPQEDEEKVWEVFLPLKDWLVLQEGGDHQN